MYAITTWASTHRWTARSIIIFIIYPLLNVLGWFLGDMLAYYGLLLNQAWCYPVAVIFLVLFLVYPYRFDKKYRNYFLWKRSIDACMILCTFCFIIIRGNGFHSESGSNLMVTRGYASTTIASNSSAFAAEKEKNPIKKIIKTLRKKYREADKNKKAGYIVLAILGAILLLFALLLLTCSIACSGAEALAYTVFILGFAGIIILLARVLRRIKHGPRKKKAVLSPTS